MLNIVLEEFKKSLYKFLTVSFADCYKAEGFVEYLNKPEKNNIHPLKLLKPCKTDKHVKTDKRYIYSF